jgi:predicted acetyltransferase
VRLVIPLAKAHGMTHLWITCNPENAASRRTIERLGATFVEVVDIPKSNLLYEKGERQKCRYRLDI